MFHHVHSSGGDELDMTPHGWPVQHHDMQMDQFHCKPTNANYSALHVCFLISSKLSSIAYSLNTHCDHAQNLAWAHVFFQLQMWQLHSVTDCHVSGKMLFTLAFFNSMMCEKLFGAWWGVVWCGC